MVKIKKISIFILIIIIISLCGCAKQNKNDGSSAQIFSEKDLETATICLYSGTPFHAEILQKYPNAKLDFLNTTSDMLLYLQQHKADCMVIGKSEYDSIEGNKAGLTCFESSFAPVTYGCIFSNAKLNVRDQFNEFIAQCKKDGRLEALKQEWMNLDSEKKIDCSYSGENGVLKIGTEAAHAPMTYVMNNKIVGFEIDLICQFCEQYGYIPEIEDCGWDPMNMGVLVGKYDIGCSNIMYSYERSLDSNFSDTYLEDPVLVGYINPNFIDLSTLSGKTISVLTGAVFDQAIMNHKEIVNPNLLYFEKDVDSFNSVINGKAAAGVADYPLVYYSQLHGFGVKVASDFIFEEHCCFTFSKDFQFQEEFNRIIKQFKKDGTIDLLMDKWYASDDDTAPIKQDWPGLNGSVTALAVVGAAPTSYLGKDGEVYGFDAEILMYVCKELDLKLDITLCEYPTLISSLSIGKTDVGIGGIAYTEERAKAVDFSEEVYTTGVVVFTKDDVSKEMQGSWIESIKSNFTKTFITEDRWELFIDGCVTTLMVSIVSLVSGTILGFAMYMICRKGNKVINKVADFYLWLINGLPVVVLLMILYYVIFGSSNINGLWISAIGFTLIFGSSMLGMLKLGVGAIDKGQEEAGLALGYSYNQTFFKIILPQAARVFLPSYQNEVVQLIKGTAVVGYIAVQDLTKVSDLVRSRTFAPFFPLIMSAVLYFIMAWLLTIGVKLVLKKVSPIADRNKRAEYLKGVER